MHIDRINERWKRLFLNLRRHVIYAESPPFLRPTLQLELDDAAGYLLAPEVLRVRVVAKGLNLLFIPIQEKQAPIIDI